MDPTFDVLTRALGELARRLSLLVEGVDTSAWDPIVTVPPASGRVAGVVEAAGLDHVDLSVVLTAAARALDPRFGGIFAGLANSSAGTTSPSVGTVLTTNGLSHWDPAARARFGPQGLLRRAGLIEVGAVDGSLLDAPVTVPERVVAFLLGDEAVDPSLLSLVTQTIGVDSPEVVRIARALQQRWWNIWIHDGSGGGPSLGSSALAVLGAPAIVVDLARLRPGETLADVFPLAVREAVLTGGGVVIGPVDPRRDAATIATLSSDPIRPVMLVSAHAWDPAASAAIPVLVGPPRIDPAQRAYLWSIAAENIGIDVESVAELGSLRLAPEQIVTAATAAVGAAIAAGEPVGLPHLRASALAHGTSRLLDLARRIVPRATFDDLVVAPGLLAELRSLPGRHETRHMVRDEWGLGQDGGRGSGLTCLFDGPSGTGKTLSAEVVANALGVDLFIIDLSQIVDKYIGETEKNLERVFVEAEGVNGVLLFDEADALFGKRSSVQSSHDRHANVEVAYLLQRMERYDGIAVLTTNFRGNIDEAFARRLDVVCSFVEPGKPERVQLWRRHLPPSLPQASDIDLPLLAEHLVVSGGIIRNITLTAAHAAAVARREVTMADLVAAAAREYRKVGRLFNVPALLDLLPADA